METGREVNSFVHESEVEQTSAEVLESRETESFDGSRDCSGDKISRSMPSTEFVERENWKIKSMCQDLNLGYPFDPGIDRIPAATLWHVRCRKGKGCYDFPLRMHMIPHLRPFRKRATFTNWKRTLALLDGILLCPEISIYTLKTDIIRFCECFNLTPNDIRIIYDCKYVPLSMMLRFPSKNAYDTTLKAIQKKGHFYKLEKDSGSSRWDSIVPSDGTTNICHMHFPVLDLISFHQSVFCSVLHCRGRKQQAAIVRFHSRIETMNAFITKNRGFCCNGQISVRVIE